MRMLALVVMASGCLSSYTGSDDGRSRPGVMPMLSELPTDPEKRDAILEQSAQTPGPEMRKGQTKKEKKAETAAATVAALIGSAFSTTQNVTIGHSTMIEENDLVHPTRPQPTPTKRDGDPPVVADPESGVLVPWVKLTPRDAPAP